MLALPQAALRLKQGFGRLIRRSSDRGAVVILDNRILGRDYGKAFLDVLPPASRFIPHHEPIDAKRGDDDDDVSCVGVMHRAPAQERGYSFAQQLEARDRQEANDRERAEGLEFFVAVRMLLVGSASRDSDKRQRDEVIQEVEPRLQRRADHRERAGMDADHDFAHRHNGVEHQYDDESAFDGRGSAHLSSSLPAAPL